MGYGISIPIWIHHKLTRAKTASWQKQIFSACSCVLLCFLQCYFNFWFQILCMWTALETCCVKTSPIRWSGKFLVCLSFLWPLSTQGFILQDEILCTIFFKNINIFFLMVTLCNIFFSASFHDFFGGNFPWHHFLYSAPQ